MNKSILLSLTVLMISVNIFSQTDRSTGTWKTWFISSSKNYRLSAPAPGKNEVAEVIAVQRSLDSTGKEKMLYWNAGAPGYRWQQMVYKLWMSDTTYYGTLAYMLVNVAIYDATVAAWDTKYAYNRKQPFDTDKRVKLHVPRPSGPSYPCEYSVAAGVATSIISHFFLQ